MTIAQAAGWWIEVDKKGDYTAFLKTIQLKHCAEEHLQ